MTNRLSMCLVVLFAFIAKFDVVVSQVVEPPIVTPPPPDSNQTNDEICICGIWYAVMATEVSVDTSSCSILTNNKVPCSCTRMDIHKLGKYGFEIFGTSKNLDSSVLTIDWGGASGDADNKEINAFVVSQVSVPASVISTGTPFTISEVVDGTPLFLKYHMSIVAYDADNFFMITDITLADGSKIHAIWSRKTHPGKEAMWTKILASLQTLNIDPHSMAFISQDNCTYPTLPQFYEMYFC